jgi:hypothetical protein
MMATTDNVKSFIPRLVVKADAEPPRSKLLSLSKTDSIFKGVFERRTWRRRDKKAETLEPFMVQCAVDAEWEDQEICNLIIDWRRQHEEDFIEDPKHYRDLIDKARAVSERAASLRAIDPKTQLPRAEALQQLSQLLEVKVVAVQRFTTDPVSYALKLGNTSKLVELATRVHLLEQRSLAGDLFDYASVIMPTFKAEEWRKVQALICASVETVESAPEFQYLGSCREWLRTYLSRSLRTHPDVDQRKALSDKQAGIIDGEIWFPIDGLRRSIMQTEQKPPTKAILSVRLKNIGCHYDPRFELRYSDVNTSRSLWRAPADILSELELKETARR